MPQDLSGANHAITIPFVKMQGVGNDFVVVDDTALAGIDAASLAIALCERRFGIGADGLLIIGAGSQSRSAYSFAMRNPDGTPDMCGNGMRCAALYACHEGIVEAGADFLVETQDGLLPCRILSIDTLKLSANVRVQMPVPEILAKNIPFTETDANATVIDFPLDLPGEPLPITAVNTGSTHSVAFRHRMPDDEQFFSVGPAVEYHSGFPERTSLIWTVQKSPSAFAVRIWERGAGETLGCGTGACAAGVAAVLTGRASHGDQISIESRGGTVWIDWPSPSHPVALTGPAAWVFSGEAELRSPFS